MNQNQIEPHEIDPTINLSLKYQNYMMDVVSFTDKNIGIEIAHIKPFNECDIDEKYDVANGIPLSRDIMMGI